MSKNNIEFENNFKQAKEEIKSTAEKGVTQAVEVVRNQAKSLAPTKTGNLKDTISTDIKVDSDNIVGTVGSPLMYASYVENGTGEFASNGKGRKGGWVFEAPDGNFYYTTGMKPQPFLKPAFIYKQNDVEKLLAAAFKIAFSG